MAKKKLMTSIADLLPEGLDESILGKIAELLAEKIDEEVKLQMKDLNTKVRAFIRGNIERLKEQAVKELELENETFRNAQLFETVRSMFAVELTNEDELNGMTALASIGESQENKINTLVKEVEKLLKENSNLKRAGRVLTEQNKKLSGSMKLLSESLDTSKKSSQKKFSDKAVIVSADNFKINQTEPDNSTNNQVYENEWLNGIDLGKKK